jgi:hypothetical protein
MDGEPYSLYPIWYKSKLIEGKFECKSCYAKAWYIKNKEWIQSRQRRFREQRRALMAKMLASLRKIDRKKNKSKKF